MESDTKQNYRVKAVDLTHDGLGVVKLSDGYTVFVEDLLKGETADIEITSRQKKYGFGIVTEFIQKSPYRLAPKCKHFYDCGGCGLMHMDYDVQLAFKKYRLELMLKKLNQEFAIVNDIICMVNPYYYRNKVEIKFSQSSDGKLKAGFFRAKTHKVIDLSECYTMSKKSFELLTLMKNVFNELGVKAYNPETKDGILKSCVIRESTRNKEIVVLFNLAEDSFKEEKEFVERVSSKNALIKGIGVVKAEDESSYSKDEIRLIYGKNYLNEDLLENKFEIGFRSFFQVNTIQTERLYKEAIRMANLSRKDKVIDAYCGIGSIALSLAKKVYRVFGIEIIGSAIVDAKRNAELNGIKNAFFEAGNAEKVIQKWKKYNFDCIFIDPPRKGCSKSFIETIINMKIPKIVYISCNPATLGRDLQNLIAGGYKVNEITPVDMFPQTTHVESVTLLTLE